jgi:hypothetical protein
VNACAEATLRTLNLAESSAKVTLERRQVIRPTVGELSLRVRPHRFIGVELRCVGG